MAPGIDPPGFDEVPAFWDLLTSPDWPALGNRAIPILRAWSGVGLWLLVFWGYWLEGRRPVVPPAEGKHF